MRIEGRQRLARGDHRPGDNLNGRGSESAKEVVQLFDVFKEANRRSPMRPRKDSRRAGLPAHARSLTNAAGQDDPAARDCGCGLPLAVRISDTRTSKPSQGPRWV